MPKLPDDMSAEAVARRAAMSINTRRKPTMSNDRNADGENEIDKIAASLGFKPGEMTIIRCTRGGYLG